MFAGYLLFDEAQRFNVHAKVGYGRLSTDAASYVVEKQKHSDRSRSAQVFACGYGSVGELQLEHEYYDKDARQTGLAVQYAF